jgi:N6-adenosine-specific RNA methylase IME4
MAKDHYGVMTMDELKDLNVGALAADTSALCLWATGPLLPEAIDLMRAWGWVYKGVLFTWIKQNKRSGTVFMGCGSYTRANPEFVLLGVRGKVSKMVQHHGVNSAVLAPHMGHSVKPLLFNHLLDQLFGPDTVKLELFARSSLAEGWYFHGNEVLKYAGDSKEVVETRVKAAKAAKQSGKKRRRDMVPGKE